MDQKCDKLYPSAPLLENIDLEKRSENKINEVNSFNNHVNNIKEMITYFKDKNNKPKKRYIKYKTLNTILESIDSIVIIGATSASLTLSITGVRLIILPLSAGIACGLSLCNKILQKLIKNKYNKFKKQYERDQIKIKSFDKLYRKALQDNVIDKNEYESLCNIFTKYVDENKNESFFINLNLKIKLNFFSHNKLKFQGAKNSCQIDEFFTRGRHEDLDVYYISQSYFALPRQSIRKK